jgi:hypothetical protein
MLIVKFTTLFVIYEVNDPLIFCKVVFTLFPCYCYKFKMKERHKITLFLYKHAKIILICSFGIIKQLLPSYEVNIQIVHRVWRQQLYIIIPCIFYLLYKNNSAVMPIYFEKKKFIWSQASPKVLYAEIFFLLICIFWRFLTFVVHELCPLIMP